MRPETRRSTTVHAAPLLVPARGDRRRGKQRGSTLLFAVAILALLSLFSVVFARLMSLERRASAYYSDRARAKMAARAGVERAIVQLQAAASRRHWSDPWTDRWGYRLSKPLEMTGTTPATYDPPLDLATTTTPSFAQLQPGKTLYGSPLTVSGVLGEPYAGALLVYRLKVIDSASQLNVNHPDGPSIRRMLKNLLRAALGYGETQANTVAAAAIPERMVGRFRSKPEVASVLVAAGVSEADWLHKLRDLITVNAWTDPSVIRPWNLNGQPRRSLSSLPRSPINLNTASEAVLTALFADLSAQNRYGTFTIPYPIARQLAAAIVARRGGPAPLSGGSVTATPPFNPFRTWVEFEAWLDDLAVFDACDGTLGAPLPWAGMDWAPSSGFYAKAQSRWRVGHRDLVKAMLNPNAMITKFGQLPNHGGYKRRIPRVVDKSDIVGLTTEGCFDSMGIYEITSAGMTLMGRDGGAAMQVVAAATDQMVVQVYQPLRLTTQQDFEQHRAFMIDGNFIVAPENDPAQLLKQDSFRNSINTPVFFDGKDYAGNPMPVSGWPGMVTGPEYSIDRSAESGARPTKGPYPMADWDGHLMLTNMITVRTGDSDFIAGFARGRLDAFKARAWWEPAQRRPTGAYTTTTPSRPLQTDGGAELTRLTRPLSGDPPDVGTGAADSLSPRVRSKLNPSEASLLAADVTGGAAADVELFTGGAALTNTGVLISPERKNDAGEPFALAYDGDNVDLVRGTSIQFWVQPLRDPHIQEQEVLLSFMGSNGAEPGNEGGKKREVGFRVYKEYDPFTKKVYITLEALGKPGLPGLIGGPDWSGTQGIRSRIRVDVTPLRSGGLPGTNAAEPEWVPGTWHWIAINLGPGDRDGNHSCFASLQVDKARSTGNLVFRGDQGLERDFGEVYGHYDNGDRSIDPIGVSNAGAPRATYWFLPRLLGDFYHCQAHKQASAANVDGVVYTKSGPVAKAASDPRFGPGVVTIRRTKEYGHPKDGKGPAIVYQGDEVMWFPYIRTGDTAGQYVVVDDVWPAVPFPALAANRKMWLRFYDDAGNPAVFPAGESSEWGGQPVRDLSLRRTSDGQWSVNWPRTKHPSYGPDPYNDMDPLPAWNISMPPYRKDGGYPGDREWHISVVVQWDEPHYLSGSPWGNPEVAVPEGAGTDATALPLAGTPFRAAGKPTSLPADLLSLPMVERPEAHEAMGPFEYGEGLPYSVHNSGLTLKGGWPNQIYMGAPGTELRSWIRTKQPLPGSRTGSGVATLPLDVIDDDCHGCEDCDVDGPVFIGGEPSKDAMGLDHNDNYRPDGRLMPVNEATMACAVFDNVLFLNGDKDRRTDSPTANDHSPLYDPAKGGINLVARNFEDRFFQEDLSAYLQAELSHPAGTGAVYHRGLLELMNGRGRLGSMTWTSYPTNSNLDYELGLWKFENEYDDATREYAYRYDAASNSILSSEPPALDAPARRDVPDFGAAPPPGASTTERYTRFSSDPDNGILFSKPADPPTGMDRSVPAFLDGLGNLAADPPEHQQLLILGVRLRELGLERKLEDEIDPASDEGALLSPILETPILEDVTINVITPRPVIIYAEEGALE